MLLQPLIATGDKQHSASKNTNMAAIPRLNFATAPRSDGARIQTKGAKTSSPKPTAAARESPLFRAPRFLPRAFDRAEPGRFPGWMQRGKDSDANAAGEAEPDFTQGQRRAICVERKVEVADGLRHRTDRSAGKQSAREQTGQRTGDGQHQRFEDKQSEHLPPRNPQTAQDADLAPPLYRRDGDGVVNQKHADEERDQADEEQPHAKGRQQRFDLLSALARTLHLSRVA